MTTRFRLSPLTIALALALALSASPAGATAPDPHAHTTPVPSEALPNGPDTLLGGDVTSGGFGAPVVKLTSLDGDLGVIGGVRGAWLLDHRLAIGLGGYWMATDPANGQGTGESADVHLWYGGLEVEYTLGWTSLVHGTLLGLIGPGAVHRGDMHGDDRDVEHFLAAELIAGAELNLTQWARLGLGAGYRLASGSDDPRLDDSALSGPVAMVDLKLGAF